MESPSSGGPGNAVTSVTPCFYRPHLNTNAADSCSHTQTLQPLPWLSVNFLLSQGQPGSSKQLQKSPRSERNTFSKTIILKAITVAFNYMETPKNYRIIEL